MQPVIPAEPEKEHSTMSMDYAPMQRLVSAALAAQAD
jgi:hypothetical protein